MSDLAEYHCDRTLGSYLRRTRAKGSSCPIRFRRLIASVVGRLSETISSVMSSSGIPSPLKSPTVTP